MQDLNRQITSRQSQQPVLAQQMPYQAQFGNFQSQTRPQQLVAPQPMMTNFISNGPQQPRAQPAIIRPKALYANALFTPEQEAFLKSVAAKS